MNLGSLKTGRIQGHLGCWLVMLWLGCLERHVVMAQVNDAAAETRSVTSSIPLITIKGFLEGARNWGSSAWFECAEQ
ncbi:MAG: hypothetical protein IPK15_10615 [Verrucomicrobia bacterium]|nr:hypothetical protein [Verrucomicrobiota bacterium]